jgi:hypothetical protein
MYKKTGLNPVPNAAGFVAQNAPEAWSKMNEVMIFLKQSASGAAGASPEETAANAKKAVADLTIALKNNSNMVMMAHHAGHIYGGDLDVAIKSIYDKFGDTMTGLLAKQQRVVMELRKAHSQNTTPIKRTAPQETVGVQQTSSPPFKRQQRGNGGRGRGGYNGNNGNRSEPQWQQQPQQQQYEQQPQQQQQQQFNSYRNDRGYEPNYRSQGNGYNQGPPRGGYRRP